MNQILKPAAGAAVAGVLVYALYKRKTAHRMAPPANDISTAGHPRKHGVHVRRRRRRIEEDHVTFPGSGYVEGGGGGHKAGGGKHSVLDEKKMISGRRRHR